MNRLLNCLLYVVMIFSCATVWADEEVLPARDTSGWQSLIMVAIAFAFFYFILWRPEQKRRKEIERKRATLQKGDRVNAMGILGSVVRVGDQSVILKMYDGSKIEVVKAAISEVLGPESESSKKEDEEGSPS